MVKVSIDDTTLVLVCTCTANLTGILICENKGRIMHANTYNVDVLCSECWVSCSVQDPIGHLQVHNTVSCYDRQGDSLGLRKVSSKNSKGYIWNL